MFSSTSMDRVCTQTIKVPFPNKVFFNTETTIKLPKAGDGISKIQLVLDLPFVNTYQENIIQYAELLLNGDTMVEKLYGEFMHIENQLITPIEKQDLLSNLLCSNSPGTVYLDLPFYSVKKNLFELDNTYVRILFAQGTISASELQGFLLVDYIVTESLPKEPYFQRSRKISSLTFLTNQSTKTASVFTYIPGPVYEIFVTVQDAHSNEYVDVIESMTLFFGENERFNLSGQHLKLIEPLRIYKRYSRTIPVYVYSFRLNRDIDVPSGQTNLTENHRFVFTFFDNEDTYKVNIWTQSHDFFYKNKRVNNVFNSDELIISTSFQEMIPNRFQDVDFRTSYTFYVDTAAVTYTSNIEISNVYVVSTNANNYTINQNEIIFDGLDSLNGDYYANVVFSAYGFRDLTCYFNFKSPTAMNEYIKGTEVGFYDVLFSGSPKTIIDGDQRFNVFSGTTLNTVNLGGTGIKGVVIDNNRNYIVNRQTSVTKYNSGLSSVWYTVTGSDFFGVPDSCVSGSLIIDTIPSSNIVYVYSTDYQGAVISTYSTIIQYARIHRAIRPTFGQRLYISGTTIGTGSISLPGLGITINKGTGVKSFLMCLSNAESALTYSVVVDESSGPTYFDMNSTGPVMLFPVTSSSSLFVNDVTYEYNFNGISLVQFDSGGRRVWSSNVSSATAVPELCRTDIFDNTYFTYYVGSTNYYIKKLDPDGTTKWTKNFTDVSTFSMNVFFSQDVTFVAYTNTSGSTVPIQFDSVTKNIPAGLTEISAFDSDGVFIEKYVTPTSNVVDFTNKAKELYYTPPYKGVYFSNNVTYTYTDATRRYWGLFVLGFPSINTARATDSIIDTVFTGQFGPISSNIYPTSEVLPELSSDCATFVIKADPSGNVKWFSYIDSTLNTYLSYTVNMSTSGDVYASGTYGPNRSNIYNSDGTMFAGYLPGQPGEYESGVYLVKFDNNGFAQWQTYMAGINRLNYNYSVTERNNNVYVTGLTKYFPSSNLTLYNAKLTGDRIPTPSGVTTTRTGIFVVKYNSSGQAQWLVSFNGSEGDGRSITSDIVTDSSENVYTTVNIPPLFPQLYPGSMIQSDGTTFSPLFIAGGYVVKMTSSGFGILAVIAYNCYFVISVSVDPTDNSFIVVGRLKGNAGGGTTFYEWNGSDTVSSGVTLDPARGDDTDTFIAKYNSSGVFQWRAYIIHNPGKGGECIPYSVACDSTGNIYVVGSYSNYEETSTVYSSNDVAFPKVLPGTGTGTRLIGDAYTGGFLVKYNQSGICQWVVILDSNSTTTWPSLSIDSSDNIVVTSSYYGRGAKFYDSNGGEHSSQPTITPSQTMTYCVKYDTNGFLVPV